jgi:PAS domain S-box-containing protein
VHEPSFPTPDKIVILLTFVFMSFNQALELLKRLLPFAGLLLIYESFRSVVPHLNTHVNYMFMVSVDKVMGLGELPTSVLQRWLWHGAVQWYDFMFYITYMLHFVLPFALAIVIWKLREKQYWRYVTAYLVVSFSGFLTFLAFPAAPPWMASDNGYIAHIARVSSNIWDSLGIHDFPSVYNKISPNPVAAVPSLHAAYATLFALFVFALFKRTKWKYLALVYPINIYFGTVYMGEHYAIDEILGIVYAVGAYYAAPYVLRWVLRAWHIVADNSQRIFLDVYKQTGWYNSRKQIFTNPYLLPYEIGIVANLAVIVVVWSRVRESITLIWLYAFLSTLVMLCVAQIGLAVVSSQTAYDIFASMRGVGLLLLPGTMLLFTLSYLAMKKVLGARWFHLLFIIPGGVLIVLGLHTQLIYGTQLGDAGWHRWGYDVSHGPLFVTVTWALQVGFLTSLALLFMAYRRNKEGLVRRRQLRLLFIAILIPYIGEVFVQTALGAFREVLPPPDSYLDIIMAGLIAYAILRYGLFSVDSEVVGANVVTIVPSAVIALNERNEIVFANSFAANFFGYSIPTLIGKPVGVLLPGQIAQVKFLEETIAPLERGRYNEVLDRTIRTKDGKEVAVNIYASKLEDRRGGLVANVLVFTSIQEIKKSSEELRQTAKHIKEQNIALERQRETVEGLLTESQRLQGELRTQNEHIEELVKQRT